MKAAFHIKRLRVLRPPCLLSQGQLTLCCFLICKVVEIFVGLGSSCPPGKHRALDMRVGPEVVEIDYPLSKCSFWQKVEGITFCLSLQSWPRRVKFAQEKGRSLFSRGRTDASAVGWAPACVCPKFLGLFGFTFLCKLNS